MRYFTDNIHILNLCLDRRIEDPETVIIYVVIIGPRLYSNGDKV